MKKSLVGIGIITSLILSGCSQKNQTISNNIAPKSVVQMMKGTKVVGWENYTDDTDKDKVPNYLDKCPNTPLGVVVDKNGCPLDTDKDGIPNYLDNCPNTPLGVEVGSHGCALDTDKDKVPDYLDKCPNTPLGIAVDKYGCALDVDKDGVPNYLDKCSNTPLGAIVNANGCAIDGDKDGVPDGLDKCPNTPAGAEVNKNGCAIDSDKDGVINLFDKCPNTPKGVVVGKDGCPLDTDKDGVPDMNDKCPNTPIGMKVNFQGCPVLAEYRFNFKTDSSTISKTYYSQIKKLAEMLKNSPETTIEIQGFTDNVGSYLYNKQLSLKRANALRNILIKKYKISSKRIHIMGYGSDNPIATNSTKAGQALNRRIVVIDNSNLDDTNLPTFKTKNTDVITPTKVDEPTYINKEKSIDR